MRLLLDTHIFLWWDAQPEKLSAGLLAVLREPSNSIILSVASVWEMQIKSQLGKLSLHLPLSELVAGQQKVNKVEVLPIKLDHVLALQDLPAHHKDPFDRLLAAQAMAEKLTLATCDPIFTEYGLQLIE